MAFHTHNALLEYEKVEHICDRNSGKPGWILIFFAYLETGMNALCKQATYFFILHVS